MFLVRVQHKRHSAWDSEGKSEGSHIVFTAERVRQRRQILLQYKHIVTHLWTCLCFCGAAARFTSPLSSLKFSYSITNFWSMRIFSSMTKSTSFPLWDSHRSPMWSGSSERLTWVLVHPHRFQLMFTVSLCPCLSHFTPSFPTWQLALRSSNFNIRNEKKKKKSYRNRLASLYNCIDQILVINPLACVLFACVHTFFYTVRDLADVLVAMTLE